MSISVAEYEKACAAYDEHWALLDRTLYDLCRSHPGHGTIREVEAKLFLIGRTYMTGIERQMRSTGDQSGAMTNLAEYIFENRGEIDGRFGLLSGVTEPLTSLGLSKIVHVHGWFTCLLSARLRQGYWPHSFASKYLHFHCPAAPIYDSVAEKALKRISSGQNFEPLSPEPLESDPLYYLFVTRFWRLYRNLADAGTKVDVRRLDYYLLAPRGSV